jgi:uncharacterized membrane protein YidH (DUF202 family)
MPLCGISCVTRCSYAALQLPQQQHNHLNKDCLPQTFVVVVIVVVIVVVVVVVAAAVVVIVDTEIISWT